MMSLCYFNLLRLVFCFCLVDIYLFVLFILLLYLFVFLFYNLLYSIESYYVFSITWFFSLIAIELPGYIECVLFFN